jgi:hypothetical protein
MENAMFRSTNPVPEVKQSENSKPKSILSMLMENSKNNPPVVSNPEAMQQDSVEVIQFTHEEIYKAWKVISNVTHTIKNNNLIITNKPKPEFVAHHTIRSQKYFIPSLNILFDQDMTKAEYAPEIYVVPADSKPIKGFISSTLAATIQVLADMHKREKILLNRVATEKELEFSFHPVWNETRRITPELIKAVSKRLVFPGPDVPVPVIEDKRDESDAKNNQPNQTRRIG